MIPEVAVPRKFNLEFKTFVANIKANETFEWRELINDFYYTSPEKVSAEYKYFDTCVENGQDVWSASLSHYFDILDRESDEFHKIKVQRKESAHQMR
jgi:hypothetical protein